MFHAQLSGTTGFSFDLPLSEDDDEDLRNGDADDLYLDLDEDELPSLPPLPQAAPTTGSTPTTNGSTVGTRASMVHVEPTPEMLAVAGVHGQDLMWYGAPPGAGQGGANTGASAGPSSSVNADGVTGYGMSIDEVD